MQYIVYIGILVYLLNKCLDLSDSFLVYRLTPLNGFHIHFINSNNDFPAVWCS